MAGKWLFVLQLFTLHSWIVLRAEETRLENILNHIFNSSGVNFELPVQQTVDIAAKTFYDRIKCAQQGINQKECVECLSSKRIFNITNGSENDTLQRRKNTNVTTLEDISRIGTLLINYALTFSTHCNSESITGGYVGNCKDYAGCVSEYKKFLPKTNITDTEDTLEKVENLLREIKVVYEPLSSQPCFSAEKVLAEMPNYPDTSSVSSSSTITFYIIGHLLKGECIDVGESVADFLEDIFLHYGDGCNRVITQTGFAKLLNDLKSTGKEEHKNHGTPQSACSKEAKPVNTEFQIGSSSPESQAKTAYSMRREVRSTKKVTVQDHEHKSLANECLSSDVLLQRFLSNGNKVITTSEFMQLCPALVQQTVSGVCNYQALSAINVSRTTGVPNSSATSIAINSSVIMERTIPSTSEIYLYSFLAVAIVSLTSLCGVFIIPLLQKNIYRCIMIGFLGLSFGTMTGDAVLHIWPQFLGLHSHEEIEVESAIPEYILLSTGLLSCIYFLFFLQTFIAVFSNDTEEEDGHGHSHIPEIFPMQQVESSAPHKPDMESGDSQKFGNPVIKSKHLLFGFSSMAIMIILGDTLHNFGDGIAIGAAFASGLRGGISTTLAVFCHELPHEIGDFIVLISTGLPFRKALAINFLSALFSFLGLILGIYWGADLTYRKWIQACTAGVFLYTALSEMMPELTSRKNGNSWKLFIVKNGGVLLGVTIMFFVAVYEDDIKI